MLVFGHTGITLGVAVLTAGALTTSRLIKSTGDGVTEHHWNSTQSLSSLPSSIARRVSSWLTSLGELIDIRILLVGSLLPDIIDKPLGYFVFREALSNGRIFCHTLLFLVLLTVSGLFLYLRQKKTWLLVLSFGTFTHLVFDQVWQNPQALFWPLYGFAFEKGDASGWIANIISELLADPATYVPELVGLLIISWFVWVLVQRNIFYPFIRYGWPAPQKVVRS